MAIINIKDTSFKELIVTSSAINDAPKITLDLHPIRFASIQDLPLKMPNCGKRNGKRKRNPNRWK